MTDESPIEDVRDFELTDQHRKPLPGEPYLAVLFTWKGWERPAVHFGPDGFCHTILRAKPNDDWAWACRQLNAGRTVRRKCWETGYHISAGRSGTVVYSDRDATPFVFTRAELAGTDWELYVEPEKSDGGPMDRLQIIKNAVNAYGRNEPYPVDANRNQYDDICWLLDRHGEQDEKIAFLREQVDRLTHPANEEPF
jgi:hypothetical protein